MRQERYRLKAGDDSMIFEFTSEGIKGRIRKRVAFQFTGEENIYNLAFGDVNEETDDYDNLAVTNNGDSDKVLATVASTVFLFSNQYPDAVIYAKGSTPVRTRLYRIGISKNFEELSETFDVFGLSDDKHWKSYEKNKSYSAFFIKRKNLLK